MAEALALFDIAKVLEVVELVSTVYEKYAPRFVSAAVNLGALTNFEVNPPAFDQFGGDSLLAMYILNPLLVTKKNSGLFNLICERMDTDQRLNDGSIVEMVETGLLAWMQGVSRIELHNVNLGPVPTQQVVQAMVDTLLMLTVREELPGEDTMIAIKRVVCLQIWGFGGRDTKFLSGISDEKLWLVLPGFFVSSPSLAKKLWDTILERTSRSKRGLVEAAAKISQKAKDRQQPVRAIAFRLYTTRQLDDVQVGYFPYIYRKLYGKKIMGLLIDRKKEPAEKILAAIERQPRTYASDGENIAFALPMIMKQSQAEPLEFLGELTALGAIQKLNNETVRLEKMRAKGKIYFDVDSWISSCLADHMSENELTHDVRLLSAISDIVFVTWLNFALVIMLLCVLNVGTDSVRIALLGMGGYGLHLYVRYAHRICTIGILGNDLDEFICARVENSIRAMKLFGRLERNLVMVTQYSVLALNIPLKMTLFRWLPPRSNPQPVTIHTPTPGMQIQFDLTRFDATIPVPMLRYNVSATLELKDCEVVNNMTPLQVIDQLAVFVRGPNESPEACSRIGAFLKQINYRHKVLYVYTRPVVNQPEQLELYYMLCKSQLGVCSKFCLWNSTDGPHGLPCPLSLVDRLTVGRILMMTNVILARKTRNTQILWIIVSEWRSVVRLTRTSGDEAVAEMLSLLNQALDEFNQKIEFKIMIAIKTFCYQLMKASMSIESTIYARRRESQDWIVKFGKYCTLSQSSLNQMGERWWCRYDPDHPEVMRTELDAYRDEISFTAQSY